MGGGLQIDERERDASGDQLMVVGSANEGGSNGRSNDNKNGLHFTPCDMYFVG